MQRLFDDYCVFVHYGSCGHGYAYVVNLHEAIEIAERWQREVAPRWKNGARATVFIEKPCRDAFLEDYARSLGVDCFFGIPLYQTIERKKSNGP